MFLEKRYVLVEKLFLKILGPGRDHHAFSRQNRGNQVRQSFSRASAGLHQQMFFFGQSGLYRFGHLELARTKFISRVPLRQRAVAGKELP